MAQCCQERDLVCSSIKNTGRRDIEFLLQGATFVASPNRIAFDILY